MGTKELSATAYLISWARSIYPDLSRDKYAHLWLTDKGKEFSEKFHKHVTPATPQLFSLRSRHIIDQLKAFEKANPCATIVNVGSGVTSYPFLLDETTQIINIDQPYVLEHYQEKATALVSEGLLPRREIIYKPIDLNSENGVNAVSQIIAELKKPVFVLFEGILTYLERAIALELVNSCVASSVKGSKFLVHVALDGFSESEVWRKIEKFFIQELRLPAPRLTTFSENEFYAVPDLKLIEHIGFEDMAERFNVNDFEVSEEQYIDERFFLFERI